MTTIERDDIAAWLDQRAQVRAEQYARRLAQRRADREAHTRRRAAGLTARHTTKLARQRQQRMSETSASPESEHDAEDTST